MLISLYWGSLMIGRWAGAISAFDLSSKAKKMALEYDEIFEPFIFLMDFGEDSFRENLDQLAQILNYVHCIAPERKFYLKGRESNIGSMSILEADHYDLEKVKERILEHIARLLDSEVADARRYDPIQVIAQFRRSLGRELDLVKEARNLQQFARAFAEDSSVQIPRVYWEYTNDRVNVQEEIIGLTGVAAGPLHEAGLDPQVLAARGADLVLRMVLEHGYFHADPHPGNVIFMPGNRIGMIDFGMVGMLTETRRHQIVDLMHALIRKDERALLDVLMDWGGVAEIDEDRLAYEVTELMMSYDDLQLKDVKMGALLNDVTSLMRDNSLMLPADLTLLFKTLITLEGLGQQLDPHFHMIDHVTPYIEQIIRSRYTPQALMRRGRKTVREGLEVLADLPRDLTRLVRDMRRGRMKIDLDLKRLDHFGHQLDEASNRLTMGILTASLVIGSSIIMTVEGGPKLFGLPLFGLLGFLIAFVNSMWIILSIWRSGKH